MRRREEAMRRREEAMRRREGVIEIWRSEGVVRRRA